MRYSEILQKSVTSFIAGNVLGLIKGYSGLCFLVFVYIVNDLIRMQFKIKMRYRVNVRQVNLQLHEEPYRA